MPKKSRYLNDEERAAARRQYMREYMQRWRREHGDAVLKQRLEYAARLLERYKGGKDGEEAGGNG